MSNLYRARSLLYRRQILQLNIRWKALDEIYKIYMRLHRSDLNISAKLCQTKMSFRINSSKISLILIEFCPDNGSFVAFSEFWLSWFSTDSKNSDQSPLVAAGFLLLGFSAAPPCKVGRLLPFPPCGLLLRWSGFSWFSTDSKNSDRTLI